MRRTALLFVVALCAISHAADAAPAEVETVTVRGVVRDKERRPLSFVQVRCSARKGVSVETSDDGAFAFPGVPVGTFALEAWLLGIPGESSAPHVRRSMTTSAATFDLVLDRGAEAEFHAPGTRFASGATGEARGPFAVAAEPSSRDTALWIQTGGGWTRWHAAVQGGNLAFRRVHEGRPWVLYVAATEETGTCFCSGERLRAGVVSIRLEEGRAIVGKATLPARPSHWAGPPRDRVLARRGPVTVEGVVDDARGRFALPPLPLGSWRVSLVSGTLETTVDAEAGAVLDLVPR